MIAPGALVGCLRCALRLVLDVDEDEKTIPAIGATMVVSRRYGHFEVAFDADGSPIELGRGAMATTYRALDTILHAPVALKVIGQNVASNAAARVRFVREARATARLHHPNVASVTFYGEQEGECFYAMELIEGETLGERVRRIGPFTAEETMEIGVQVARALAAAEAVGVVHRDLKPGNLMVVGVPDSETPLHVKVIDWGLAKAVSATDELLGADHTRDDFVGTPAFASPEQFARRADPSARVGLGRVDVRSDIYSLGVTLWYLLCGMVPFVGDSLEGIHVRQRGGLPLEQLKTAGVPAALSALLCTMLAFDPAARPQSARELLERLRQCQNSFEKEASPIVRWPSSRWIIGILLLLISGTLAMWAASRPPVPTTKSAPTNIPLQSESASPGPSATSDPLAGALYARARAGMALFQEPEERARYALTSLIPTLEAVVARDPRFVAAYCDLAEAYFRLTAYEAATAQGEEAAKHRILAENALAAAKKVRPDAGEIHLVQARCFAMLSGNYEQARLELDLARRQLPDNAAVEYLDSLLTIARNRAESLRHAQRSVELQSNNIAYRSNLAFLYRDLRRYAEADRTFAAMITALPDREATKFQLERLTTKLEEGADLASFRAGLAGIDPAGQWPETRQRFQLLAGFLSHDPESITASLAAAGRDRFDYLGMLVPAAWFEAMAARMRGDEAAARTAFHAARVEAERLVQADAQEPRSLGLLAMIDAGLGCKEQAIREARHACELSLGELSTRQVPVVACNLAVVYAWTGEPELACQTLEAWIARPAGPFLLRQPTYGDFRLNPAWDPLRGNPRFDALVARLAPAFDPDSTRSSKRQKTNGMATRERRRVE